MSARPFTNEVYTCMLFSIIRQGWEHSLFLLEDPGFLKNSLCLSSRKCISTLFWAGESEGSEEEKWLPTSVTPLLVQIGSLTATSPHKHWLRNKKSITIIIPEVKLPVLSVSVAPLWIVQSASSSVAIFPEYVRRPWQAFSSFSKSQRISVSGKGQYGLPLWSSQLASPHGNVEHASIKTSKGFFPGWSHALYQSVLSQRRRRWLKHLSMTPDNLWTSRRKTEVQPWTDNGWNKL